MERVPSIGKLWRPYVIGVGLFLANGFVKAVVVAGELPQEAHNAPLHLFSAAPNLVEFGGSAYQRRSEQTSRLLGQLFEKLRGEGFAVSFTMEDFNRQYIKEHLPQLTAEEQEEVLQALPPERRLAGLSAKQQEEVLQALPPERRLAGLSAQQQEEVLQALPPERRLAGLSAEQIRQYLARLSPQPRTPARKPRRKK
jgi:hypothetical protein